MGNKYNHIKEMFTYLADYNQYGVKKYINNKICPSCQDNIRGYGEFCDICKIFCEINIKNNINFIEVYHSKLSQLEIINNIKKYQSVDPVKLDPNIKIASISKHEFIILIVNNKLDVFNYKLFPNINFILNESSNFVDFEDDNIIDKLIEIPNIPIEI